MAESFFVKIVGDASKFESELRKAGVATAETEGRMARFGRVAGTVGLALAGTLAVGLEKSIHAAIEAQASTARLDQAFKNAGLSAKGYSDAVDKAESAGRQLGFTDDDVRGSLGSLITATKDYAQANRDLGVAEDLARFKHVGLEDATKMLTMAMTGSQRAAKQLGITVIPVTDAVDKLKASHMDLTTEAGRAALAHAKLQDKLATGQGVIEAVTEKVHGQGQAFADTAAGGMAQFHAQLQHIEEVIGSALLPVVTLLVDGLASLMGNAQELRPELDKVKDALSHCEGAARLLGSYVKIEMKLILGLWKLEFEAVSAAVHGAKAAIDACRAAASAIASFFTGVFHGALNTAKAAADRVQDAIDAVKGAFDKAKSAGGTLAGWFQGAGEAAFNAFKKVADAVRAVINLLASALHAAESAAHGLASALSSIHVPHISLPHIGLPHIPGTATGGIVTGPQVRLVGEAGPEAIIPLGGGGLAGLGGGGLPGGGGGITINLAGVLDGATLIGDDTRKVAKRLVDDIVAELALWQRAGGQLVVSS